MTGADLPETNAHDPKHRRVAARRLVRAELIYLVVLVCFAGIAIPAHYFAYFGWDLRIEQGLQSVANPVLTAIMWAISLPGNFATPYVITAVAVAAFWLTGFRSESVGLLVSAGGSGAINKLLKFAVGRPRPVDTLVQILPSDRSGLSFPSGHVAFYVCFFGFLFFVVFALFPRGSWLRRVFLIATALPVFTVALSRVYLGAHWPSDTLAAYLWSSVWLAFALHLYRRWKRNATFHRTSVPPPTPDQKTT
ncbi:MAG: phosphatase PAP2 family protein [Pyrinomonadaceae bacterium]